MAALEAPAFQNSSAVRSARATPKAVYAHPASFFRLIGTFRHKHTSLLSGIIGVPKFDVKETLKVSSLTRLEFEYIAFKSI